MDTSLEIVAVVYTRGGKRHIVERMPINLSDGEVEVSLMIDPKDLIFPHVMLAVIGNHISLDEALLENGPNLMVSIPLLPDIKIIEGTVDNSYWLDSATVIYVDVQNTGVTAAVFSGEVFATENPHSFDMGQQIESDFIYIPGLSTRTFSLRIEVVNSDPTFPLTFVFNREEVVKEGGYDDNTLSFLAERYPTALPEVDFSTIAYVEPSTAAGANFDSQVTFDVTNNGEVDILAGRWEARLYSGQPGSSSTLLLARQDLPEILQDETETIRLDIIQGEVLDYCRRLPIYLAMVPLEFDNEPLEDVAEFILMQLKLQEAKTGMITVMPEADLLGSEKCGDSGRQDLC